MQARSCRLVGLLAGLVAGRVLLAWGALASCSASGSSRGAASCGSSPTACAAGETCWVKDCSCPASVAPCTASACTAFDLQCLPSKASAIVGQDCADTIGSVTCGDGQWCLQVMGVNGGVGVCSAFCDPAVASPCPMGYTCAAIGVALVSGAPVVHVCALTGSDASIPPVSFDASPVDAALGAFDATIPDGAWGHLAFDGGPPP